MQIFYRFGAVLFNQFLPLRKTLFYFEYPELVLQVQALCSMAVPALPSVMLTTSSLGTASQRTGQTFLTVKVGSSCTSGLSEKGQDQSSR